MNQAEREKIKLKKERNNDLMFYIVIIMFIALAICLSIVAFANRYKPDESLYVHYDLSEDIIPDPVQVKIEKESFSIKKYGVNIKITKLASYDITGKVEAIKDYSPNFLANFFSFNAHDMTNYISPRDLAMSWGEIALDKNADKIRADQNIFNGERRVLFAFPQLYSEYQEEFITSHLSNNHVITLDKGLERQLLKIKESDLVRIIGYLVDVDCDNGWHWGPSSMSRTDSGCEIILAEDIVILNKK